MTNKEIKNYFDVYGTEVILHVLFDKFEFVSNRDKSIPTGGSPTRQCRDYRPFEAKNYGDKKIDRVILHRDGAITIHINSLGFFKFFN